MRTTSAFLRDLQILVEGNDASVGAGINTILGPGALCRVDDHKAIVVRL